MPGLHIFRSNRLEALVAVLAERLRAPGVDPMATLEVVVGSRGMERHLRHALSEHLGICANLRFPFPAAALDGLVPDPLDGMDPWSPDALAWTVLEVLPEVAAHPMAEPLRRYLADASADAVDSRTWGLARQMAHAFDRYLTFRPELVGAWDRGATDGLPEDQRWQMLLWQSVRERIGAVPHRGERLATLAQGLAEEAPREPLHVFGLTSLAGPWLRALGQVSRHRPVDLYLLCPSDTWWADLSRHLRERPDRISDDPGEALRELEEEATGDAGHPLLLSWGRTGRDLQILLESLPDGFEEGRSDLFVDPLHEPSASLLQQVQADILAAVHPSLREDWACRRLDPGDRSVQLHSCHGLTRQVEVLRTVLLELLDADPTLQPRDIVVMTPDIDRVAPLVSAVFDEDTGTTRLPWEIADLSIRRVNPVADALLRVLELVDGRASASELLDLLALDPVAERFDLDADEVATVRSWVTAAGIRWGADAAHRAQAEQPEDPQNTWRFGLDRLLLGVVMPDDGRLPAGIRPFDAVEGAGTRLVGKLAEFCAAAFDVVDTLRTPRPLPRWIDALEQALDALTLVRDHESWLGRRVREELDRLREEAAVSHSTRLLGVDAMRAAVAGRFEVASAARHGSGGAVTFCGMVPERAVPYRVVCLLGMDEGSFPRGGVRPSFDLVQRAPRVGDRDPRDEDRYLLLEAVLSARDHLVVLYTGRDPHTNEPRPPAVPVAEFADALAATVPAPPENERPPLDRFVRQHHLQAFDVGAFLSNGGPPFSYDAHLLDAVRSSLGARADAPPFLGLTAPRAGEPLAGEPRTEAPLHLDDLVWFWRHPIRTHLQQTLGLRLPRDGEDDVPVREPLELGRFDRARLLDEILHAEAPGSLRQLLRGAGALPLGRAGDVLFDAMVELARAMHGCATEICGWEPSRSRSVDIDLHVEGHRLSGRVDRLAPGVLLLFRYGEESADALLEAWIRLLAVAAMEPGAASRALVVFGTVDGDEAVARPIGLELDGPPEALAHLVRRYGEGLLAPLPFLQKTSLAVAKQLLGRDGLPPEWRDPDRLEAEAPDDTARAVLADALASARRAWSAERGGEAHERHNRHAFGESEPFVSPDGSLDPTFAAEALRVWGPVLAARRVKRDLASWGNR